MANEDKQQDDKRPAGASRQTGDPGNEQRAEAGGHEDAKIQQSAQREGMGHHRHNRGNRQAMDETDNTGLGSHDASAADAKNKREAGT